jgi:hypothetical protein
MDGELAQPTLQSNSVTQLSLIAINSTPNISLHKRVMGIEPTWPAWKAGALPLSYTRVVKTTFSNFL